MTEEAPFADEEPGRVYTKLDLDGRVPRGRRFDSCRFVECRVTGSAFLSCSLLHCTFEGCDLSGWEVEGLRLVDVAFRGCKMVGLRWGGSKADPLTSFSFDDCILDFGDFTRAKLPGLKMLRCSVRDANFERADLKGADLRESDFGNAIFGETNLDRADLRGARGYLIDPRSNRLKGTRVSLPDVLGLLTPLDIKLDSSDQG